MTRRQLGDTMLASDINLREAVVEELGFDPSFDEDDIAVSVSGEVVTLTGSVKTYAQKLAAQNAVKRVRGVHGIVEELTIDLAAFHRRGDAELVAFALEALRWHADIPADSIFVEVHRGWITLTGTVDWQYQREAARLTVASLAGVRGVSNDVTLRPNTIERDVQQKIHDSFQRNAQIDATRIEIEASGSIVTLRGSVHSWTESKDAEIAAYSIPGVVKVSNLTTIS